MDINDFNNRLNENISGSFRTYVEQKLATLDPEGVDDFYENTFAFDDNGDYVGGEPDQDLEEKRGALIQYFVSEMDTFTDEEAIEEFDELYDEYI